MRLAQPLVASCLRGLASSALTRDSGLAEVIKLSVWKTGCISLPVGVLEPPQSTLFEAVNWFVAVKRISHSPLELLTCPPSERCCSDESRMARYYEDEDLSFRPVPKRQRERPSLLERRLKRLEELRSSLGELKEAVSRDVINTALRQQELSIPMRLWEGWIPVWVERPVYLYKTVAAHAGKILSVFDGETEYWLGRKVSAKRGGASWPPLKCCFFAYPTFHQAMLAAHPNTSVLKNKARLVIKVRCQGRAYMKESDNCWCFAEMTPVGLVSEVFAGRSVLIA